MRGRIGKSVYLGENAQYDFVAGDVSLKILELNPRLAERPGFGEFHASVRPEQLPCGVRRLASWVPIPRRCNASRCGWESYPRSP